MAGASSSSAGTFKYDVFINFRGEDTRTSFICHLNKALKQSALGTFIDSEELQKGSDLSKLLEAIQDSRLSIVVFSKDYASSTWCLKELVKIMECKDQQSQIVVPIFYQVDPSHVRKLREGFAEAFAKHDSDSNVDDQELDSWKSSLTSATNISGIHSTNFKDDIHLIESIVEDVLKKLNRIPPRIPDGLIGMDTHMAKLDSLLELGANDCRIVGIWGMGGIGKSTIARAVYKKISPQFDHKYSLDNVKEGFTKNGAIHMEEELLSRILKVDRSTLDGGLEIMRERLGKIKVLLVLDDVTNQEQLDTLLGENPSFGGGSRVIITTRDKSLLFGYLVYEPRLFTNEEALELFIQHAFRKNKYSNIHDAISRRAVTYAHGLPLALKVLGGLLVNRNVDRWGDELQKINEVSITFLDDNKIARVLWASYDGLNERQQTTFLDIACCFRGMRNISVVEFPDEIPVLEERSLVTVSYLGKLEMHDLIQEMGREIVRQESKYPGSRSRLWYHEDVVKVLAQNTGTEAVEGISLDISKSDMVLVNNEAFDRMKNLRMLQINAEVGWYDKLSSINCKQHVSGGIKFLSHELRVLIWHGCPLEFFPSNFSPKNLIKIDLRHSRIKQLWEGTKSLQNLVEMDLSNSKDLIRTPDFSVAKKLERLNLAQCTSLLEVDPSISAVDNLVDLNLNGCSSLEKFPSISGNMKKLRSLYLDSTAITGIPSSINDLPALAFLTLRNCRELISLPSSIHMESLEKLELDGCSKLEKFPSISGNMKKLEYLHLDSTAITGIPSSINDLPALAFLTLSNCRELISLPSSIHMESLEKLNLDGCSKLEKFPEISGNMKELESLELESTAITGIHSSINDLPALTFLTLRNCRELISLPSSIHMESLEILYLDGCSKLEKFPEISGVMEQLHQLDLNETAIKELPSSINHLTGLVHLSMRNCTSLVRLPEEIRNLICLEIIDLAGCSKLEKLPENFPHSMWEEADEGCSKLEKLPENFPHSMWEEADEGCPNLDLEGSGIKQLPFGILRIFKVSCIGCKELRAPFSSWPTWNHQTSSDSVLDELDLSGCNLLELSDAIAHLSSLKILNLSRNDQLESLPAAMNRLRCLKRLCLDGCKKLKSIPELSPSIQLIYANNCTSLETVSSLQLPYAQALCFFQFFNCSKLVKTNLFTDIAKSVIDNQESLEDNDDCAYGYGYQCMYLPGSDIPDWFDHQSIGSSVTVQLPPDGFANEVQGFAICAGINNQWIATSIFPEAVSCCATFETTVGQKSFYLDLFPEDPCFARDTPLESDHMLLGCFHSSGSGEFEGVSECTEATFTIGYRDPYTSMMTLEDCTWITSCGVRLFPTNAPSSMDIRNLENREIEIQRNKRKRETQERGKE